MTISAQVGGAVRRRGNALFPHIFSGEILSGETARVVGIPHPLRGERIDVRVPAGYSVAEALTYALEHGPKTPAGCGLAAYVDGVPIPEEWRPRVRLKGGATLAFRATVAGAGALKSVLMIAVVVAALVFAPEIAGMIVPAGFAATGATVSIVAGAMVLAGSLALNALFPTRSSQLSSSGESFTSSPSIQGSSNLATKFDPIPQVLGKHRLYPPLGAKAYTEIVGDDQYLRMLFVWGYGPLDISDLKIGETSIGSYEAVEIETRQGFPGDAPITLYPGEVDEQSLSITLGRGGGQAPPGTVVSDDVIEWATQTTATDTDYFSIDVTFPEGVYKVDDDTGNPVSWISAVRAQYRATGSTGPWIDLVRDIVVNRAIITARRGAGTAVTRGQYDVRVGHATYSEASAKYKDEAVWTALRSFHNGSPVTFSKPLAMTALRIKATDQLNGAIQNFNGMVTSLVNAYSGSGSTWTADTASQWPADLYRHVLQGNANARPVDDSIIDLENLQEWWAYCVANGWKFNQVRTQRSSVYSVLADIASAGRAVPTFIDGKWGVVWDRPDDTVVQHFTPRNSWDFSGSHPYATLPHGFRVRFIDETNGYAEDERIVYDDGYDATSATLFESIEFPGVTDPALIWRHGRFHIAQSRLRPEEITLNVGWENIVCTRGDRVRVTHDALLIGLASCRVKSVSGQVVTLDDVVTIESGKTYSVRFRHPDEMVGEFTRSVDTGATGVGETTTLTLSGDLGNVSVGLLVAFGETDLDSAVYRVKTVQHQKDLVARLTLVDDAPAVSTADQGTIPAYSPNITIPADSFTLPPQNLTWLEVIDGFGASVRALVRLTWQVPRFGQISSFEVQYLDVTGGAGWVRSEVVAAPHTTSDVPIINAGQWQFRVRCLFDDGTVSDWTTTPVLTLLGLLDPPDDISNFRFTYDLASGRSYLTWDEVKDARTLYYEVRKGASWDAALVVGERLAQPRFPTVGDDTYWIAAFVITPFGATVYSTNKRSLSVVDSVLVENVVVSHSERAENWPGALTGYLGRDDSQNYLRTGGTQAFLAVTDFLGQATFLDGGGQGNGEYYSKWIVNAGRVSQCRVSIDYQATAVPANADFLGTPSFLDQADFLQSYLTKYIRVYPIIRVSQTGPGDAFSEADIFAPADVFSAGTVWSAWEKWSPDNVYVAQSFQVGMAFEILDATVNAVAYGLKFDWTVDVPDRLDRYQNLTVPLGGLPIVFEYGGFNAAPTGATAAFTGGPNNALVPHVTTTMLEPGSKHVAIRDITNSGCSIFVLDSSDADVGGAGVNAFVQGY